MVYQVAQQSAVIKPTSTLGIVTSGPRVSVTRLGSENFITTPVGASFHIYDCNDLQLQYLSRPLTGPIRAVLSVGECTVVSVGSEIFIFHKMTMLVHFKGHADKVDLLSSLGDSFLVSVSATEVFVWQLPNLSKQMHAIEKPQSPVRRMDIAFPVTSIIHVPTYLNKMLIGGVSGELELWNINTGAKIHTFTKISESPVSCIAASPALDVVGLGFQDGSIAVVNLKQDEVLMTLNQKEHGPVTALSFRLDSVGGQLVSGTSKGDLVVWDLNKRGIHSFLQSVHPGGVGTLTFLDNLPLLLSAGSCDNAISVYIFDKPDGGCRLLKERRGFTSDFTQIFAYGENDLLVAGNGSNGKSEVGKINLIQSQQNNVWSQSALHAQSPGKGSLMPWKFRSLGGQLPAVTSIGYCGDKLKHFDWPAIVTTHEGIPDAYVWSPHQQALVTRMLIVPRKATTGSKAPDAVRAAVSTCGNYAVVGLANGELHRFNVQSCYHRGLVGTLESAPLTLKFLSARDLISADKNAIRIWKVVPRPVEVARLTCVTDIASIAVHGFLCAVAHSAASSVSIVDIQADRKARTIAVTAPVTAMVWARGGRWLAIATQDARLVIYDVPTAAVVDRVEFSTPILALHFTANNTSLVTSHVGGKGAVRVWQNMALLSGPGIVTSEFVNLDNFVATPTAVSPAHEVSGVVVQSADIDGEFVLSSGPRSRWQQILKLDEIKERNKPLRPAEKPKAAPFFLPVKYQGVEPVFIAATNGEEDGLGETPVKRQRTETDSGYLALVKSGDKNKLREHLLSQTPSGVHICLAELEDDEESIDCFLAFLAGETEAGHNLDLVATWTALFVKLHGGAMRGRSMYASNLARLEAASKAMYDKFELEANQLQCLLKVTAALQLHR